MITNTDKVIPNELAIRMRAAEDDIQGAAWADMVLRKISLQTPANSELGLALALVGQRVHRFNREADTRWRQARLEADRTKA